MHDVLVCIACCDNVANACCICPQGSQVLKQESPLRSYWAALSTVVQSHEVHMPTPKETAQIYLEFIHDCHHHHSHVDSAEPTVGQQTINPNHEQS